MAELAQKVGTNPDYAPYLEPFVPTLLQVSIYIFLLFTMLLHKDLCLISLNSPQFILSLL